MTITNRIEINPKVMLGKPVIWGTRIPVELILRKLSEGAATVPGRSGLKTVKPYSVWVFCPAVLSGRSRVPSKTPPMSTIPPTIW